MATNPLEDLLSMGLASGLTLDDFQQASKPNAQASLTGAPQVPSIAAIRQRFQVREPMGTGRGPAPVSSPQMLTKPSLVGPGSAVVPLTRNAKPGAGKGAGVKLKDALGGLALMDKSMRSQYIKNMAEMDFEFMEDGGTTVRPKAAIAGEAGPEIRLDAYKTGGARYAEGGFTDPLTEPMEQEDLFDEEFWLQDEEYRRGLAILQGQLGRELTTADKRTIADGIERVRSGQTIDSSQPLPEQEPTGRRSTVPLHPSMAFGTEVPGSGGTRVASDGALLSPTGEILSPPLGTQEEVGRRTASQGTPDAIQGQPGEAGPPTEFRSMFGRDPNQWRITRDQGGHLTWQRSMGATPDTSDGLQEGRVLPDDVYVNGIPPELLKFMDAKDLFPSVSPEMAEYLRSEALKGSQGLLMAPGTAGMGSGQMVRPTDMGMQAVRSEDLPSARVGTGPLRSVTEGPDEQGMALAGSQGQSGQPAGQQGQPRQSTSQQANEEYVVIDGQRVPVSTLRSLSQTADGRYNRAVEQSRTANPYKTDFGALAALELPTQMGKMLMSPVTGSRFMIQSRQEAPNQTAQSLGLAGTGATVFDLFYAGPNGEPVPVREGMSIDETKQTYAILMGGSNPAMAENEAARRPDFSKNMAARYETDPSFKRAVDDALGYFDSEEGVQARTRAAADRDPVARRELATSLIESGQLPIPQEEMTIPASAIAKPNAEGRLQFDSSVSLENPVYNDQGGIVSATVVTENGSRYIYQQGKDTLQLADEAGNPVGQAPQEEAKPAEEAQTVQPIVIHGDVTGTPAGQVSGPNGEAVEVFEGSDGQWYWQDADGTWYVLPEGEVPTLQRQGPQVRSLRA